MAERREVSPDITEAERRDLVRRIALRGSRGRDLAEATVAPSRDFSAAAEAAIAADPVELSPVAMSDLGEMVNAPTAEAARFAEAQREIFRRGQERELAAGQRYFDDARTVTEATNFALAEYEDQLERLRRARQKSDPNLFDPSLFDYSDSVSTQQSSFSIFEQEKFEEAEQNIDALRNLTESNTGVLLPDYENKIIQLARTFNPEMGSFNSLLLQTIAEVRDEMINDGISPQDVVAYLRGIQFLYTIPNDPGLDPNSPFDPRVMPRNVRVGPGGSSLQ